MESGINDFIVESLGHCFLCMNTLSEDSNPLPWEPNSDPESLRSSPIYSLQSVAKYLQMNLKKVFTADQSIPPNLLTRMDRSRLKVFLCESCATTSTKLAKLIQQLEKVQLEIRASLEIFQSKLLEGDEDGTDMTKVLPLFTNSHISSNAGLLSKLEIMKIVRAEAKQKCSNKLAKDPPRVKIQKLTQKEIKDQEATNRSYFLCYRTPQHDRIFASNTTHFNNDVAAAEPNISNIKLEEGNSPVNCVQLNEDDYENMDSEHYDVKSHSQFLTSSASHTYAIQEYDDVTTERKPSTVNKIAPPLPTTLNAPKGHEKLQFSSKLDGTLKIKYACKYCTKQFRHQRSYDRHYNAVHANIEYRCHKCNKRLSDSCNLSRHLKQVHSQVRNHECNVCGFKFKARGDLKAHLRRVHFVVP